MKKVLPYLLVESNRMADLLNDPLLEGISRQKVKIGRIFAPKKFTVKGGALDVEYQKEYYDLMGHLEALEEDHIKTYYSPRGCK